MDEESQNELITIDLNNLNLDHPYSSNGSI